VALFNTTVEIMAAKIYQPDQELETKVKKG